MVPGNCPGAFDPRDALDGIHLQRLRENRKDARVGGDPNSGEACAGFLACVGWALLLELSFVQSRSAAVWRAGISRADREGAEPGIPDDADVWRECGEPESFHVRESGGRADGAD